MPQIGLTDARRGAQAELVVLRQRLESAGLVAAETVLPVQHHG